MQRHHIRSPSVSLLSIAMCCLVMFTSQAITVHADATVRLWDVRGSLHGPVITMRSAHTDPIVSIAFRPCKALQYRDVIHSHAHSADGMLLASSKDHSLSLIDTRNLKTASILKYVQPRVVINIL